jgi:hypothetical protein
MRRLRTTLIIPQNHFSDKDEEMYFKMLAERIVSEMKMKDLKQFFNFERSIKEGNLIEFKAETVHLEN